MTQNGIDIGFFALFLLLNCDFVEDYHLAADHCNHYWFDDVCIHAMILLTICHFIINIVCKMEGQCAIDVLTLLHPYKYCIG